MLLTSSIILVLCFMMLMTFLSCFYATVCSTGKCRVVIHMYIKYLFVAAELVRYYQRQEAQLMLTTGSTRLAVSRGQQTWYHSTCYI